MSDDEEDLEQLRLAALQSIKKKENVLNDDSLAFPLSGQEKQTHFNRTKKRGRFFQTNQGRVGKNVCLFNNFNIIVRLNNFF